MVNQQLIDYINDVRKRGHSDQSIKDHLVNNGYPIEVVEEHFMHIGMADANISSDKQVLSAAMQPQPSGQKKENKKPGMKLFIIPLFFLLIAAALIFAFAGPGQEIVSSFSSPEECEGISVSVFEKEGEPFMCIFDENTKVQMILKNTGDNTIDHLRLELKGNRRSLSEDIYNVNRLPQDVFPKVIDYDPEKNGLLKSIEVIPGINIDDRQVFCYQNKIIIEDISSC